MIYAARIKTTIGPDAIFRSGSQDNIPRAGFFTCSAVGTLLIVNVGAEIIYGNRAVRTGFLAFFTSDAARVAGRRHSLSFIMRITSHHYQLRIWDQLNKMPGTFFHAFHAQNTFC